MRLSAAPISLIPKACESQTAPAVIHPLPAPTSAATKSYLPLQLYRAHHSFLTASLGPTYRAPKEDEWLVRQNNSHSFCCSVAGPHPRPPRPIPNQTPTLIFASAPSQVI